MSSYCDGAIVGSAVVKIIDSMEKTSPEKVGEFIKLLRENMDK